MSGNLSLFVPASATGPAGGTLVVTPLPPTAWLAAPPSFQVGDSLFLVTLTDSATGRVVAQPTVPLTFVYRTTADELSRADGDLSRVRLVVWSGSGWAAIPCAGGGPSQLLACSVSHLGVFGVVITPPAVLPLDADLPQGHFFKEANGFGGAGALGFAVTDDAEARFWSEFQRLGGMARLGWPSSHRFWYRGFVTQAFQKLALQWRPELGQAVPVNILQEFTVAQDGWLAQVHGVPVTPDPLDDLGLPWEIIVARHQGLLGPYPQLAQFYLADPKRLETYGLPLSVHDFGGTIAVRLQRAVLEVSAGGALVVLPGSDLAEEVGLWPLEALTPGRSPE